MTVTDSDQEAVIRKAAGNLNQQLITVRERYKSVPNDRYYDVMVMLNSEIKALAAEMSRDMLEVVLGAIAHIVIEAEVLLLIP